MVTTCVVKGCKNEKYPGCVLSFHGFPKNPEMQKKWLEIIGKKYAGKGKVCSIHFEEKDYDGMNWSRKILKKDAVPSLNLTTQPSPSYINLPTAAIVSNSDDYNDDSNTQESLTSSTIPPTNAVYLQLEDIKFEDCDEPSTYVEPTPSSSDVKACRFCLAQDSALHVITEDIHLTLTRLIQIEIDTLKYICIFCLSVYKNCVTFINKSRRAFNILQFLTIHRPLSVKALKEVNREYNELDHNLKAYNFPPESFGNTEDILFEVKPKTVINMEEEENVLLMIQDDKLSSDTEENENSTILIDNDNLKSDTEDNDFNEDFHEANKKHIRYKKNVTYQNEINEFYEIVQLSAQDQKDLILKRKTSSRYIAAPFKCEICFKGTQFKHVYEYHMFKHDKQSGPHKCPICEIRCSKKRMLYNHKRMHQKLYKCKLCSYEINSSYSAKKHMEWHQGKTYTCSHCGAIYRSAGAYLTHLRVLHPPAAATLVCTVCGYSFLNKHGLKNHRSLNRHDIEVPPDGPRCDPCDLTFANEEALKTHLEVSLNHKSFDELYRNLPIVKRTYVKPIKNSERRQNGPRNTDSKEKTDDKQFWKSCRECGEDFSTLYDYRTHVRLEHPQLSETLLYSSDNSRVMCHLCGKMYSRQVALTIHMREHEGLLHKCKYCDKSYRSLSCLKGHMAKHTGKEYKCQICDKVFASSGNRVKHIRNVHVSKNKFQCDVCKKMFKSREHLGQHKDHVHFKKPWPKRRRED